MQCNPPVVNSQGKNKDIASGVSTVMQFCEDLKKKEREDRDLFPADLSP